MRTMVSSGEDLYRLAIDASLTSIRASLHSRRLPAASFIALYSAPPLSQTWLVRLGIPCLMLA